MEGSVRYISFVTFLLITKPAAELFISNLLAPLGLR